MRKEVVEIRINKEGNFTLKAKEGFSGASCMERTKDLEVALGGSAIDTVKTDDYYKGGDKPSLRVNIK